MNIYFEDIFCESSTPANDKTPNDYCKVNLLSLCERMFNLYIILKPELFYEIGTLYHKAYLLILPISIPNCRGIIAGDFSKSLNGLCFQVKSL